MVWMNRKVGVNSLDFAFFGSIHIKRCHGAGKV